MSKEKIERNFGSRQMKNTGLDSFGEKNKEKTNREGVFSNRIRARNAIYTAYFVREKWL